MSRPKLSVQPRSVAGKAVKRLRAEGLLPAVVYGRGHESQPVQLDAHDFELLRRTTGRNALVDLAFDGAKPMPVLLQHIQEHPLTRRPLHIDFLVVAMTEELTVDVPISFVGEAPAVDKMGGVLLHMRDNVTVRALPDNLPSSLEVDISSLDSFEGMLHVSDLVVPAGVTLVTDGAEALARVQPPRVEEVAEPAAEEAAAEGEEAAEGAAASGAEGGDDESQESAES